MATTATDVQRTGTGGERKLRAGSLWMLQLLLALNFLFVGAAKLAGMEPMVATFEAIGLGQWFRFLTGILEVGGAILLLVPRRAAIGAVALGVVMVGAVAAELLLLPGNPFLPMALLLLLGVVAYARRSELSARKRLDHHPS